MDILSCVFIILGVVSVVIIGAISDSKYAFFWVFCGLSLILLPVSRIKKMSEGKPAPLSVLVAGGKYEVVGIYEKYIIVKSATDDNKELKFIGPLNSVISVGKYVKTAEKSLEKIE